MKYFFEDFNIEVRKNKIMLSAPHCYSQLRKNVIKKREVKTGVLVKSLAKQFQCSCIYKTKFYSNDPNWDKNSTYKEQLVDFISKNNIKFLFDIHSMNAKRDVDVCICSNHGKNILNRFDVSDMIKNTFEKYGFENTLMDNPFSASNPNVISKYVSTRCNIPCFQIELNNKFLFSGYDTYNFKIIYNAFEDILNNLLLFI